MSEGILFSKFLEGLIFGFSMLGRGLWLNTTVLFVFFSVVCSVFEKLVNNRLADHLKNCGFLSDFQYGIWSSQPTAVLLPVLSDRIGRAFNRSGAIQAVALNISKSFNRVLHAGLLRKHKSSGISGQVFGLFSSFLSNRQLRVVLDGVSPQEYRVMLVFLKSPVLVPHFSF